MASSAAPDLSIARPGNTSKTACSRQFVWELWVLRQLRVLHVASSQKHDSGDGVTGYHNKLLVKAAAAACLLHQQSPNGPSPNQQQLAAPVLLNMCASVVHRWCRFFSDAA